MKTPGPGRRLRLRTTAAHAGRRLDLVVGEWLREALGRALSRSTIRRLIVVGAVRLDGVLARRPAAVVSAGRELEADIRAEVAAPVAPSAAVRVLYEDDHVVAVDKPSGLPTHAGADRSRANLVDALKRALADRGRASYLGVHQRLDRDTSGVVLFAKTPAANAGLARAFTTRDVEKVYLALTARPARPLPPRWTAEGKLGPIGHGRRARMGSTPSGRDARTDFHLVEELPGGLLVEARPATGRKHQIRVHLAEGGMPILGDDRYGSGAEPHASRVMLHAARLALPHPVSGARLVIECPPPADFAAVLQALRAPGARARGRSSPR